MKKLKTVLLVVVLLLVPVYALSADLGYMRISFTEGDVQVKTPDTEDWGYASVNTPLAEGDQLWAPEGGRVELQLNSGSYLRLSENSALQILSLDKDSSQFYLSQGSAYLYYDGPNRSVIQVDTPDASTRAFKKAIFRIDMSDKYTDVAVYKGYAETENQVGRTRIKAGQMLSLGQNTNGELGPMGPSDEWEIWNKTRNNRFIAGRGDSSRYLPAELSAYSHDLDSSGRWVQVPDYGHVWTPTVVVGASWSPYRDGRWIWRGGDYVWVGSEPWGWAPYHYGRWSFGVNIGWFWVPPVAREVYWSPGYVGWVRTADYVAWVPLAPGETYYGRGHYGRNSVNITTVNINQVNINVYKNIHVNNGVTVVNRNTFNTGTPVIVNVNKNTIQEKIFVKNNFSVGTPDIKPTKESYFASTRQIQPAKLPPQPVRDLQVKELKRSRPLIKDRDKSVLNPGVKPESLPVDTVTAPRTPGKGKPAIQQVKPEDRRKPARQEDRRGAIEEKKQVKPEEREVKPEDRRKPAEPEGRRGAIEEKKQVKPEEREVKPEDRRKPAELEDRRGAIEEKKQVKPEEREVKREEKKKSVAPEKDTTNNRDKQQVQPEDRRKPAGPDDRRGDKDERRRLKSEEREVKPEEKKKSVAPEKDTTNNRDKQQVQPDKKGKHRKPECGPGQKDEKDPEKCPPEDKGKPVR